MASMAIFTRKIKPFSKTLTPKSITTFTFLSQEPQLAQDHPLPPPQPPSSPLPPNPASGSPLYNQNWRNPNPNFTPNTIPQNSPSLIPLGFQNRTGSGIGLISEKLDGEGIMNLFADWMTAQRWEDIKQVFEVWIRSLDGNGKPNKPDVSLYNYYLRANLMMGASAGELLDLAGQMEEYMIEPNTASYNLVLKAMFQAREADAAVKVIDRMIATGKNALPDEESYHLVIRLLLTQNQIDAALKYIDLTLKSGYMLSVEAFTDCVRSCVNARRLDTLVSIIERCKKMDQNKALCPPWNLCNYITDVAMQSDNSELAFHGLEFMARWIARGEKQRPPVLLSVDEGLVVNALTTAGRNYNSKLLDGTWAILKRSLRQKRVPSPESYLAKIYAYSSFGNLPKAFSTLHEFEISYKDSPKETEEDMFSPFTSLYPLVVACCKAGFATLDTVYYQLENLSRADPPYKSVAALNCVILGCANIWDVDRAYQTFTAMESTFGLTPDIHSYNALICAFGKLHKRDEAVKVFEHLVSLGVKPNATSYALLVDAHLVKRDAKAALSTINDMVVAGLEPTKEILKKVRRRCVREMDYESDDKVDSFAKDFRIRMGNETRRDTLFNLEFTTEYA